MEHFGVDILKVLTIDIIHVLTIGVLGGLLLNYVTGYLFFKNRSFQKIISVMIIGCGLFFIFDFIPIFGVGFGHLGFWILIKYFYNEKWAYAGAAWAISIGIPFVISVLLLLLIGMDVIFIPN